MAIPWLWCSEALNGDAAMPRPGSAGDDLAGAAAGGTSRAQHAGAGEKAVLDDVFAGARGGKSGDGGHPEALYPAGWPSGVPSQMLPSVLRTGAVTAAHHNAALCALIVRQRGLLASDAAEHFVPRSGMLECMKLCAGRVLWLIPAEDEATGSGAASDAGDDGEEAGLFQSGGALPQAPAGTPDSTAQPSAGEHRQPLSSRTAVLQSL